MERRIAEKKKETTEQQTKHLPTLANRSAKGKTAKGEGHNGTRNDSFGIQLEDREPFTSNGGGLTHLSQTKEFLVRLIVSQQVNKRYDGKVWLPQVLCNTCKYPRDGKRVR